MAYKTSSLILAHVFIVSILLAIAGQAIAARDIPSNPKNDDQMKQPENLIGHDRSFLIPGFGRVLVPPVSKHHHHPHISSTGDHIGSTGGHIGSTWGHIGGIGGNIGSTGANVGSIGGNIGGTTGGSSQIPGGDDTFVPNPGFEVPIPGRGAGTSGTYPNP